MQNKFEEDSKVAKQLREYFGDRLSACNLCQLQEEPHLEFEVEFQLYDYFRVLFHYDNGEIGCEIKYGEKKIKLPNSQMRYETLDRNLFFKELEQEIELRIPDKYLKAQAWKPIEEKREKLYKEEKTAKEHAEECIGKFQRYFGNRVKNFSIIRGDDELSNCFRIRFIAYNYYIVSMGSGRGGVSCSISIGEYGVGLRSSQQWYEWTDMEVFLREMEREIELRIPDKYLKAYGWK